MKENILDDYLLTETEPGQLRFYRDFHSEEEAKGFAALLRKERIPYSFDVPETIIDSAIVGSGLFAKIVLNIRADDFTTVNNLIVKEFENLNYSDFKDHYLIEFENTELNDLIENQDEWTLEDVQIAKLILKERGVTIDEASIAEKREAKFAKIRAGKKGNRIWMWVYFLSMAFGVFIHEVLTIGGFGMAFYYTFGKNTDQDGNRHFTYDAETRKLGKYMLIAGIPIIIIIVLLFYFYFSDEYDYFNSY